MGGVIDPWLVAGSSLYWAAVVFSFAFDGVFISPAAEPSFAVPAYGLVALMLLCFIPIRQAFEHRRSRQMVALTMALVVGMYTATGSLTTVPQIASDIVSLAYLTEVNGALGLCLRIPRQVAGLPECLLHRAGRCHARVAVIHSLQAYRDLLPDMPFQHRLPFGGC